MAKRKPRLKRVYEPAEPTDGTRILVERLWPRGLSKDAVAADLWLKEIAPSPELRAWYGHDRSKWAEFRKRYLEELEEKTAELDQIRAALAKGPVTFLFATRDADHSSAAVLKEFLESGGGRGKKR